MRTLAKLAAAAVLAVTAPGCLLEPDHREERLGVIQAPGLPAQVGVPDSVAAGQPFVVSVLTHGGGCLHAGPTRVRREGMTADVRPYDLHLGEDLCTDEAALYPHIATLRFEQPGRATVRFVGIGQPGREVVTITRTVTIR